MIHTASFFEPDNFGNGRLVSIAMRMPDSFIQLNKNCEIAIVKELRPSWNLVSSYRARIMTVESYKRIYYKLLHDRFHGYYKGIIDGSLGPEKLLELWLLRDGDTLLCWEKYGKFCHRQIVADLLEKNDIDVKRK